MDLRRLRYFIAVAEEGHVTRAAERLGMQQPPLTQQIKALERELGVQLIRRKSRGIALTEAGAVFLEEARAAIARLEHGVLLAKQTARGEQGRLVIGIAPTAPFHPLVPRAIRSFRQAYPFVSLLMDECLSRQAVALLGSGQIDVALLRAPLEHHEGLTISPLLDEPMVVALPAGHALARGRSGRTPLELARLSEETFILYGGSKGPGIADVSIAACHRAGFSPRLGQQAPRIASALSLVSAGLGIAFVPSSIQRLQVEGVAYRPLLSDQAPTATLTLATRKSDPSPIVSNFVAMIRSAASQGSAPMT